jgi:Translation initiation factor 2 (IF-2; GTPase)
LDPYGSTTDKANPSEPVTLMGWRIMPNPGDVAIEVKSEVHCRGRKLICGFELFSCNFFKLR